MLLFTACHRIENRRQPFYSNHKHIGDSIFIDGRLSTIVINDTLYKIDSIDFNWYDKEHLRWKYAFRKGRKLYENIDYYPSGKVKTYRFIMDPDCDSCNFIGSYNEEERLTDLKGPLCFATFVGGVDYDSLTAKENTEVFFDNYYPSPPNCIVSLTVKPADGVKRDVFYPTQGVSFLKNTAVTAKILEKKWHRMDTWFDVIDTVEHDTFSYNKVFLFTVVK